MMDKQKNSTRIGIIYFVLLALFNLLAFTMFRTYTGVFWISYLFITLAFVIQVGSMFLSFKTSDVETVFFGISLFSLSVYYLIAEICVGFIFMFFQVAGFTLAFVLQAIILAVFVVVAVLSLMGRDAVVAVSTEIKDKVSALKMITVDLEMILASCTDPELRDKLKKVAETAKYSDPMSNEVVEEIEARIKRKVSELRIHSENNQTAEAVEACGALELLFVERNKKLYVSK